MLTLTRMTLARALRAACINKHVHITKAADALDMPDYTLRSAWCVSKHSRMSWDRMITVLNRLGYDVFFTIRRKGLAHDASDQRLPTSEDQGVSARQLENPHTTAST